MNLKPATTLTSFVLVALLNCALDSLPAFAAPTAKSFGQLPGIYDAAISPDGLHIAVVINVKGNYGVLTRTTKKSAKKPKFHSLGDKVKPRYVKWVDSKPYPGLHPDTIVHGVLKKGHELVISDYQSRDTLGLYVYDLVQKKVTRKIFHHNDYDAAGVVLSKNDGTVIGAKYTADSDKTVLLDENGMLLDQLRRSFPNYDVDFVDQSQDGDMVLVIMSAPFDPGGLYIYQAGDENPSLLSKMYDGISETDTGNVTAASYSARDGQKIPAFITFPPTVQSQEKFKNLPFIVLPHGGPFARDSRRFDYFAQFFATRGYGVLQGVTRH